MQQVNIQFKDAEQVRNFLNIVSRMEVEFQMGAEKSSVNAKSVLGLFTLDLSRPQPLRYDSSDHEVFNKLRPFFA